MPSDFIGMKPNELAKFRKRVCTWIDRLAAVVAPRSVAEFVPQSGRDVPEACDGFVVLNGGILSGCSPYDLRELLLELNVIERPDAVTQTFFYSSTMPFTVVSQRMLVGNANSHLLSWESDILASAKQQGAEAVNLAVNRSSSAIRQSPEQSTSLQTVDSWTAKCLRFLFVLPIPAERRIHKGGSSFNAAPTSLLLLPCVAAGGIVGALGPLFQRWVLGIDNLLAPTRAVLGEQVPRLLPCHSFASIPGLFCVPDFLTQSEHDAVMSEVQGNRAQLKCQFLSRRRVAHFNRKFIYGVNQLGAEGDDVNPHPSFYEWMRQRLHNGDPDVILQPPFPIQASRDGETRPPLCDQLTANYYEYSDSTACGIAAHVDAHSAFADLIFIVSLGSATVLEYVPHCQSSTGDGATSIRGADVTPYGVYVPPRSLVIMSGECRYGWTHCIAERRTDTLCERLPTIQRGDRVSLTWRNGRDERHCKSQCLCKELCDGTN